MKIKEILNLNKEIEIKKLNGWVIFNRGNNKVRFLTINDGSTFRNIQVVFKEKEALKFSEIKIGSSIEINGLLKFTKNKQQKVEIISLNSKILKLIIDDFPLQKQKISKENLREIPHIRHRTNIFRAIMRIRSTLIQEIHFFFAKKNFLNVSTPIITSNDGEGSGETFLVDDAKKKHFFTKKTFLTVTGQLHAEAYANGFGDVYTFGPTFRAEKSHTKRHASEFWMVEPEMAFYDMDKAIELAFELIKYLIDKILIKHHDELTFLEQAGKDNLISKLKNNLKEKLIILDYKDAIEILIKNKSNFENQDIKFGLDLNIEHEKYLVDVYAQKKLIAIVNFPQEIKAFYMYQNSDHKTVKSFDILAPGIGELIGGSQRESNYEKLLDKINQNKINQKDLQWYLDLRKQGFYMSSGFGLGFERLVMYLTNIDNIRDVIPFPRTPNKIKM